MLTDGEVREFPTVFTDDLCGFMSAGVSYSRMNSRLACGDRDIGVSASPLILRGKEQQLAPFFHWGDSGRVRHSTNKLCACTVPVS